MRWYKYLGIIGWSITIPTLTSLAAGVWISSFLGSTSFIWLLLIAGIIIGVFNGWYWFCQEIRKE